MTDEEAPEQELPEIDPSKLETFAGEVVTPEAKGAAESAPPADESITLIDQQDQPAVAEAHSKIRMTATGLGVHEKTQFRRALNLTGTGAMRCKIFYAKIAPAPMEYVEKTINDWLDKEEVEVKFATQVVGTMEGKRAEPNLIITIWY